MPLAAGMQCLCLPLLLQVNLSQRRREKERERERGGEKERRRGREQDRQTVCAGSSFPSQASKVRFSTQVFAETEKSSNFVTYSAQITHVMHM